MANIARLVAAEFSRKLEADEKHMVSGSHEPGSGGRAAGRLRHIGATAELITVDDDVVQIVKVMTGLIHVRFAS